MVVVVDLAVDCLKERTDHVKTVWITKLIFEASVKGFFVPVLPGRSHITDRDTNGVLLEVECAALGHELVALIRVKDRRFVTRSQGLLDS